MRWLVGDRYGRTIRRFCTERDAIAFALTLKENGQYAYVAYEGDVPTATCAEPADDVSQWWSKDRMAEWWRFVRWIEREEEWPMALAVVTSLAAAFLAAFGAS